MFIDGKLTTVEKDSKIAEVDKDVARWKIQSIEADKYITKKEAIIDYALLFMSDPSLFWNLSDISVKKRVQDTIFPEGLTYDFETGFGTAKLSESYQLISKIADESATYSIMAPGTGFEPAT